MAYLNIEKARQLGYSDDEILAYMQANPQLSNAPQQMATAQAGKGTLIQNLLPLIGSILGGTIGAPLGPVGMVGGSAIGGGLGEFGRQAIGGEDISGGKILKETAIGGAGGVGGLALTKLLGAGKIAQAGTKIAAKPYTSEAIKVLKGRNIAGRAAQVGKTATTLKGATAPTKLTSLEKTRAGLNELLGNITQKEMTKTPVKASTLLTNVLDEAGRSVDISSGVGKANIKFWAKKIGKVTNVGELSKLNEEILGEIAKTGIKSQRGQALSAIQKPITAALNAQAGTEGIFAALSKLNAAEPIIAKQASKVSRGPFQIGETGIPQRIQEGAQSLLGGGVNLTTGPVGRRIGGQVGARALLGGEQPAEQYTPEATDLASTAGYTTEPETKGFNITAEQAAMARLLLPDKQADAIEAAYKLLQKSGTESASQEFLDKAVNTIGQIESTGKHGYGPLTGRLYEFRIGQTGGQGLPQDVVSLNQKYTILKLNILRAYQGARISDKDFELANLYIPRISDSEETAKTKLKILNDLLVSAVPPTEKGMEYQTD